MNLKIGNRKTATGKVTVFDGFRHVSLWISRRLSSGEQGQRLPCASPLGSPCKGGESRALPVADEARRTSGSGQNFSGFNAAAKFWAPQQVMSSVSETERLTGLRQSFRGADRVVRPYKITGHRYPISPCPPTGNKKSANSYTLDTIPSKPLTAGKIMLYWQL